MKSKITKIVIFAIVSVILFGAISSAAYNPYSTYTYSIDGDILESPMAYYPYDTVTSLEMGINSNNIVDMSTDENGYVYIVDQYNKQIVVLDESYQKIHTITEFVDKYGEVQTFATPSSVFITDPNKNVNGEGYIYVGDSEKECIVIFNKDFTYYDTIEVPDSKVIEEGTFKPHAIAVDIYGRIFVVSKTCSSGIFVLSPEGDFNGFIGGQKVSYTIFEKIFSKFLSAAERAEKAETDAPAYNNITIDEDGFVYATVAFTDAADLNNQLAALESKDATYSPVKKFNSVGDQILNRNGFFDPAGEVDVFNIEELSTITDIAIGAEGAWTILDNDKSPDKRIRTYTYDQQGNLLYAFGDKGDQLGNVVEVVAMCYQVVNGEYRLLLLDKSNRTSNTINIYTPTDYCKAITKALYNENSHNYSESIDCWQDVLTENNNLDLAYIGMGKGYYFQGKYEEAMKQLESAYDTKYYSMAYTENRKDLIAKRLLLIAAVVVVIVIAIVWFLGYAKRVNKRTTLKVGRKSYWEELIFCFHLIFHPFDGFWDLKHEQRGSVRAASTIFGLTILAFFYQSVGQGYMFNPRPGNGTIFTQIIAVGLPVVLWVISNWCLTTLFDGEGSMKDIYIATCYSLTPLPFLVTASTILSNVLSASEATIVTMLVTIGAVWMVILLFFGMVVTHDYTIGKNIITTLATIVAAAVIIFIFVLFASLVAKMSTLVVSLWNEIANRL